MNRQEFIAMINSIYKGTVTPLTAYVNERAVMVFKCSKCGVTFFGKPSHMVGMEHQKHICHLPYGDRLGQRLERVSTKNKRRAKKDKNRGNEFYRMVIEDYTPQEIAKELDMPLHMVMDYFKSEGLI